jgi:NAD(P)-dependent dehydrogenase (short-subunit alcohol dehydrogenase family)
MPKNLVFPDYPELTEAAANWRYRPRRKLLAGRTVLVTGAGDGIGRAAARTYAAFGANVVLLGRTREKLEAVYDVISSSTDTDPAIVPCDLGIAETDAFDELAEHILSHYGALDGLLHNASLLGPRVPVAHYDPVQWRMVMKVNSEAPFTLTRALLPALEKAPAASVLFVSSGVGRKPRAYWGAYAVSKVALEGFAALLADECEAGPIRVATLNPGGTRTRMRTEAYPAEDPLTLPTPEDHMDLFLYLMSADGYKDPNLQFDAKTGAPPT